jgi:hypothetical protein
LAGLKLNNQVASSGTSGIGPSVWTGRALQAENDDLEKVGLALLYPAYDDAKAAIDRYFCERNGNFRLTPQRAGKRIWGKERANRQRFPRQIIAKIQHIGEVALGPQRQILRCNLISAFGARGEVAGALWARIN